MDDNASKDGDAGAHKPRLLLIDGSGYIFRAFHALPMMTRPDGTPECCLWFYLDADEACR